MNNFFDKVFIINLDERKEKLENTLKEFEKMGITNFERFSAIKPSFEFLKENPHLYKNLHCWTKIYDEYIQGAVGCLLSHFSIIKIAKERGYKRILICEDDVLFKYSKEETEKVLEESFKVLGDDFHLLYLGGNNTFGVTEEDRKLHPTLCKNLFRMQNVLAAHCYIVNCSVYDEILKCENDGCEIDISLATYIQKFGKSYLLNSDERTNYVVQRPGFSDLLKQNVDYSNVIN